MAETAFARAYREATAEYRPGVSLTTREAGIRLGISEAEVVRRLESGVLRGVPFGDGWRLSRAYVDGLARPEVA